jgi:hypothetical protein
VEEHSVLLTAIGVALILAFIFANKIIRVFLIVLALAACFTFKRPEFTPSAESSAVLTLRQTAAIVQRYRQSHPSEGYPPSISPVVAKCRARNVYKFNYESRKSQAGVTTDQFTVVAIPISPPSSRWLRSFAITEDVRIHVTLPNEGRAANRKDPVLE